MAGRRGQDRSQHGAEHHSCEQIFLPHVQLFLLDNCPCPQREKPAMKSGVAFDGRINAPMYAPLPVNITPRSTAQSPKTMISSELTDSRAAECSNRLRRAAT